MFVNLSPIWGAGAQLFDNSGNALTGGKIYTYVAGTTTPAATYTSSSGITANSNPIILNSAGRVPYEIWLTDGISYKFVLKDSNDALIATYDNLAGINSNFIAYTAQQEIQTATAGQTVFNLTTMQYQPATNNLSVYVDGVNQYGLGAQYAYVETDSTTITFVSGLHVGASVKFTTASPVSSSSTNAENVAYNPPFTDAVVTNVEAKLAQTVSVKDFGAVGDGVTDDTAAIQAAIDSIETDTTRPSLYLPSGIYKTTAKLEISTRFMQIVGDGMGRAVGSTTNIQGGTAILYAGAALSATEGVITADAGVGTTRGLQIKNLSILCQYNANGLYLNGCDMAEIDNVYIDSPVKGIVLDTSCYSSQIRRCEIYDPQTGGIELIANNHAVRIENCRFNSDSATTKTPEFAIKIATTTNCSDVGVQGCNFDYYKVTVAHVYLVTQCRGFNFIGNYLECRGDGVTAGAIVLDQGDGVLIAGNRITKTDSPTPTTIDYGIKINAGDAFTVQANWFSGFPVNKACIYVASGVTNVFTASNRLTGTPEVEDANTPPATTRNYLAQTYTQLPWLGFGAPTAVTIATGAVTIAQSSYVTVDTEGGAATDDLDTINGALVDGQMLILEAFNSSHDVTVRDNVGNIQLAGSVNFTMATGRDKLTLIWNARSSQWQEIARITN